MYKAYACGEFLCRLRRKPAYNNISILLTGITPWLRELHPHAYVLM